MGSRSNPVRTLYVVCNEPQNPIGGSEETLLQVLRWTGGNGQADNLVVASGEGAFTTACRRLGLVPMLIPMQMPPLMMPPDYGKMIPFLWRGTRSVSQLVRLIRQQRVDMVCSATRAAHFYGGIAGCLSRCKVVFHLHDIPQTRPAVLLYSALIQHCADQVIAVSQSVIDAYESHGCSLDATKTTMTYNGVDLHCFSPEHQAPTGLRESLSLAGCHPIVSIIGRMSRVKGLEEFVRAARLVADDFPQARFLIIGQIWQREKPWLDTLKRLIRDLGLSDHILCLGHRPDVPDLIAVSDIVVLASWFESFGLSLVQAMAMEKPVVATRCGGPEEIVIDEETGFLVPVQAPHELANRILRLARDPHLGRKLGKAGRRRAEALFDIERFVQDVVSVQAELVPRTPDS